MRKGVDDNEIIAAFIYDCCNDAGRRCRRKRGERSNQCSRSDQRCGGLTKGTLVVGTSADYPPYEFTVKQNDKTKYVGFDMQIAQALAKKLGVKLVIKNMDFDSLLVALQTHKVDMVIAGMNATAERKKSVGFSNVYYSGDEAILVNKRTLPSTRRLNH